MITNIEPTCFIMFSKTTNISKYISIPFVVFAFSLLEDLKLAETYNLVLEKFLHHVKMWRALIKYHIIDK